MVAIKQSKRRSWWILGMILAIALCVVSQNVLADNRELTETDTTGVYTIQGVVWQASQDSESMADAAVVKPMKIVTNNGKTMLQIELQKMQSGGFQGYLGSVEYFSEWKDEKKQPSGQKAVAASVQKYHSGVYDTYNDPKKGTDKKLKGKQYPKIVSIPVDQDQKIVWAKLYIPAMEAISPGSGEQFVRIKPDWTTLKKTPENASQALATAKPQSTVTAPKSPSSGTKKSGGSQSKKSVAKKNTTTKKNKSNKKSKSTGKHKTTKIPVRQNGQENSQNMVESYSCKVVPSYQDPETGKVADSGGSGSAATGQGMVESALGSSGELVKTKDGSYALTLEVHLLDYTKNHTFQVKKKGDSAYSSVSSTVLSKGKDDNGTYAKMRIQIPDPQSVIKVSMYVTPMKRSVVFFATLSNVKLTKKVADTQTHGGTKMGQSEPSATPAGSTTPDDSLKEIPSEQTVNPTPSAVPDTEELQEAQGLSLSTKGEESAKSLDREKSDGTGGSSMTMWKLFICLVTALTVSGGILMGIGAGIVYYFRRNWRRWGEEMIDDEE